MMFADRIKTASHRLMDDVTLIQGATETATKGFYDPHFGSDLEQRATPSSPAITGYGADFPNIAVGDKVRVGGIEFDVAKIEWDRPTDEITLHIRRRA